MAAFGSMLEASSLISALKTLVTYSPEQTKISQLHQFDSLLSRNLEALAKALIKEPRYITLTKQLEEVGSPLVVLLKDEFDQVRCKKGEGDVGGNSIAHNFKYDIRWKFVKVCLDLLKLLKESISAAETRKKVIDQAQNAMRSGAPSLDQQVLSVSDQNTISTCFQFVASLGICPNLLPGVGVPLEIRSGFGNLFQISNDAMRNEKRLYYCIKTMVDCINQPVLGQLVLSRHLGDVLAGMLQILYAPTSSYEAVMTSSFNTILKWAKITKEKSTEQEESEKRKTASGESKNETLVMKPCSSEESCFRERATDPSKAINFQHSENIADEKSSDHKTNDYIKIFINEIEKEECSEILQRLLHTVYPPLIVRELLVLQGGMRQKPQTKTQGSVNKYDQDSVKNSSESEKRSQVKRASLFTTAPKWLWQVCGLLLSEMLMKANGLKAILKGILELSPSASSDVLEWQKCNAVARIIASCPSQAASVEDYYRKVCPQVVDLLHVPGSGPGQQFTRVVISTVALMLQQYPELADRYILKPIMAPLIQVTEHSEFHQANSLIVDEATLAQTVEDTHKARLSPVLIDFY